VLKNMYHTYNLPGFDSVPNRNEYQEYFLRGNGGRCVGLTTVPPSWPIVLKFGSLNLLEPPGCVQGCTEITLTLLVQSSTVSSLPSVIHAYILQSMSQFVSQNIFF